MPGKLTISKQLLLGLALMNQWIDDVVGSGARAYHARKLWFWTPPDYKKDNFYTTVSRLAKTKKIEKKLVNGQPTIKITKEGIKSLNNQTFNLWQLQQKKWNNKWCVVSYDFPQNKKALRDKLRELLKSLGFGQWQQSVYISPYDFSAQLIEFLQTNQMTGFAWVLTAKHQFLKNPKDFAKRIWPLEKINEKYKNLYLKFEKSRKPKRAHYQNYLNLLTIDPLLPYELLPQPWWGSKIQDNYLTN